MSMKDLSVVTETKLKKSESPALYMQKTTCLLYDVKFFDDFVIVRPVEPEFYHLIKRLSYNDLANDFEESFVDAKALRQKIEDGEDIEIVN